MNKPTFQRKNLAVALSALTLTALAATQAVATSGAPTPPNPASNVVKTVEVTYTNAQGQTVAPTSKPQAPNPVSIDSERGDVIYDEEGDDQPMAPTAQPNSAHDDEHGCEVADAQVATQNAMTDMIVNAPSRTTALKNIQNAEQTKGCLAPASEIIDLSVTLPTINASWGNIGAMVREHAKKELLKAKERVINSACNVANQALKDVAAPINDTVRRLNDFSEMISNAPDALVGSAMTRTEKWVRDGQLSLTETLNKKIQQTAEPFAKFGNKMADEVDGSLSSLENRTVNLIGGEQDYQSNLDRAKQAKKELADKRIAEIPKPIAPAYTLQGNQKDGYKKCQAGNCVPSNINEAYQIRQAWDKYQQDKTAYDNQVRQLQIFAGETSEEMEDDRTTAPTWDMKVVDSIQGAITSANRTAQDAVNYGNITKEQQKQIEERRRQEEAEAARKKAEAEARTKTVTGSTTANTGASGTQVQKQVTPPPPQGSAVGTGAPQAPNPFSR